MKQASLYSSSVHGGGKRREDGMEGACSKYACTLATSGSGDVLPGGAISANIHISSGAFGGIPN
jgi:hypothetical protein